MDLTGAALTREVAKRIVGAYLAHNGGVNIAIAPTERTVSDGVDIRYMIAGRPTAARVQADCYFGTDAEKAADRSLPMYRLESSTYALEEIADVATKMPGWMFSSTADVLLYYRMAVARPEAEVSALLGSPDAVFFSELGIERDELRIIPLAALRTWFAREADRFTPRPVFAQGRMSWCRIVPIVELGSGVPDVRVVDSVYGSLGSR
ncbi:MAG: hypothetical protein JW733_06900 [Coriobacteriia bacterium]|nr:hypothetical protein [Coriobacteriia bacterium]MBN2839940.1 hypothetical protein [Coriobacteriia bacterium]